MDPANSQTYGRYGLAQVIENTTHQYNLFTNSVGEFVGCEGVGCEAGYVTNYVTALDNQFPYSGFYGEASDSPPQWTDSPGSALTIAHWLRREDSFSTYLMFRPKPYDASTIDVPMFKVQWSWFGSATNCPWGKQSGEPTCNQPSPPPTEEFPSWRHVISIGSLNTWPTNMQRTACFNEN